MKKYILLLGLLGIAVTQQITAYNIIITNSMDGTPLTYFINASPCENHGGIIKPRNLARNGDNEHKHSIGYFCRSDIEVSINRLGKNLSYKTKTGRDLQIEAYKDSDGNPIVRYRENRDSSWHEISPE